MIKYSFSFSALTLATFLSVSPAATASTALPDIPPEQIALDIERRLDDRTGVVEFHAPTFDPFESVDQLVGRVSLKSNTRVTGIDGHIVRGGAIVDINFLYTTDSDDPYDVAGFESAVFFSGEDVNATYYDNRIIECSESIHDVVYQNDYYHGASYGLIGGLYRPYPVYRGHSFFGFRGLNYGWKFPIGFSSRSRFNSSSRFNTRSRFGGNGRFDGGRRVSNDRRGVRRGNNSRRDFDDRSDRRDSRDERRDDRRDRRSQFDGDGSRGVASRGNRDQVRGNRDETRRVERGEKRRVNRSGLRTIKGGAPASSQSAVSEARPSRATRSISASAASETVSRSTRSPSSAAAPTRSRSTRSNSQTIKSSGSQTSRSQRSSSSSSSQPKQSSSSSQPKSSRSQPKQSNRSSSRSSSRSSNRSSRSSRSSSRRKLNFFPQGFLQFGTSGYSTRTVSVSHKCARDENLSLHIPRERLEAARYEGLTVFVIDRLGQDIPVFIPPNYIEGFVTTAFGKPQSYQQPQGSQQPTYQQPSVIVPQNPSSQPRIYGDPNGVSPSGGYPQNEGF